MCGIAGIINFNNKPVNRDQIHLMNNAQIHRGPDGSGIWCENNVGLGHRRLSIIDLSNKANQPMESKDRRFILVYNGEVYNFKELKNELVKKGYIFRTHSDTEVVLNSLIEWNEHALNKFNGMFSFALFDRKENRIFIARDRYGIKPLYYALQKNTLYFASEQKSILTQNSFNKKLNKEALLEYFTFQNILTEQTLVKEINILPAGEYILLNTKDYYSKINTKKYWDFNFHEPFQNKKEKDLIYELKFLIEQAVKRQLVSDVEIGAYLSGGIDSGSITAIASSYIKNIKTFTCGFDLTNASGIELGFDERKKARFLSETFNTDHNEFILRANDMQKSLKKIAYHLEEPRVGQSYPNYYIAQLASKKVKVILSGAGGDELFAGYPWRYLKALRSSNLINSKDKIYNKDFDNFIDIYYNFWQRLIPNSKIPSVFKPIWDEVNHVWTRNIFKSVFKDYHKASFCNEEDSINNSLYFEAKTFLHGLLVVEDKISMSQGLETRLPFLDNDLVDFAQKCPVNLKIKNIKKIRNLDENDLLKKVSYNNNQNISGKHILKESMMSILPQETIQLEKQGFSSPDASWFKSESIKFVERKLKTPNAKIYDYLDLSSVSSLIDEHLRGQSNRRLLIWSLLNINEYLEQF